MLARQSDGTLLLYRGNGAGGWRTGIGEPIGSSWQRFTALAGGGDFSGDGKPDVLARQSDGTLLLYRGNGAGGWRTGIGERIGSAGARSAASRSRRSGGRRRLLHHHRRPRRRARRCPTAG